jgi:hypothetical protein
MKDSTNETNGVVEEVDGKVIQIKEAVGAKS